MNKRKIELSFRRGKESVEDYLKRVIKQSGAAHLTLIDADKYRVGDKEVEFIIRDCIAAGTDGILVGGSKATVEQLRFCLKIAYKLTSKAEIPVILFPHKHTDILAVADGTTTKTNKTYK